LTLQESFFLHLSLIEDDDMDEDTAPPHEVLDKAPGLHLNVKEKIKLLLLVATKRRHRHKLTYAAAEDVIRLAGVFFDEDSFLPSKNIMKIAIEEYSFGLAEHHVCPSCGKYIGIVTVNNFQYTRCRKIAVFMYLPSKEQLQAMLESQPEYVDVNVRNRKEKKQFTLL